MAAKAFARTAAYDAMISNWFAEALDIATPRHRVIGGVLREEMRYGENPHQKAAFYVTGENRPGVSTATLLQGKQLSYNNINDTDAAYELVAEFLPEKGPACAIIKHANPCGVATGPSLVEAYKRALACDSVSAFGGIIALNSILDAATAEEIVKLFTEVIIAPEVTEEAKAIIARKPEPSSSFGRRPARPARIRSDREDRLRRSARPGSRQCVGRRYGAEGCHQACADGRRKLEDMKFAFRVAKHVKSNAVVYAKDGQTAGIGAGQMSRVDSARIAAIKAEEASEGHGACRAADAGLRGRLRKPLLPFADGLLSAIAAGATAVIQPGGSMRDQEVIDAANEHNVAMVFTGIRHFRH